MESVILFLALFFFISLAGMGDNYLVPGNECMGNVGNDE